MNEAQLDQALYMASLISLTRKGEPLPAHDADALREWRQEEPANEVLYQRLNDGEYITQDLALMGHYDKLSSNQKIMNRIVPVRRLPFIRQFQWAVAAVLILTLSGIVFFLNREQKPQQKELAQADIKAPQFNKATITLPDGKRVMLDTVANGTLIAGIARKTADGQLVFEGNRSNKGYILASNPKNSRAMQITLPDNTVVWLNADTYLQYPTSYNAKDRLVTLKGEAYFEVVHNEAKPFRVTAGEQTIEDVGTSFNVKAYEDEGAVKTTLLEGVVIINHSISLKPGQQFSKNKVTTANTDEVMAWKSGSFYLDGRELGSVVSDISRWYDVEVVFTNLDARYSVVFGGEMGRDLTLTQAIKVLEKMNVHCRIEGKKLLIE
ncbi:MAG: FecR domain-containing protein [Sediminibacterium sp.]|nr:FecR domain-containing protein [Sediminibacterium sp.]